MDVTSKQLITLLRCAFDPSLCASIDTSGYDWDAVRAMAVRHNVQNLLACAVRDLPETSCPSETVCRALQKDLMFTVAQGESQDYSAKTLMEQFEARGIDVLPVKGVCTRRRYPEAAMRSMGDLDFLYRPEQTQKVRRAMEALGYGPVREGRKHDLYSLPPYLTVELHRELLPPEAPFAAYYANVWERCRRKPDMQYVYEMSPEDEYLFNLAHLAEHLMTGGIGIRFLADVFVYEHLDTMQGYAMDRDHLARELGAMGLWRFYQTITAIAESWFSSTEERELLRPEAQQLEALILDGGAFGSTDAAAALAVRRGHGQALKTACFPSYTSMRTMFPWLERCPLLLPYAWGLRAVRAARHRKSNVRRLLRAAIHGDRNQGKALTELYRACGLDI